MLGSGAIDSAQGGMTVRGYILGRAWCSDWFSLRWEESLGSRFRDHIDIGCVEEEEFQVWVKAGDHNSCGKRRS